MTPTPADLAAQAKRLRERLISIYVAQAHQFTHSRMAEAVAMLLQHDSAIDALLAAATREPSAVPEGFKLVPIEPTKLMLVKGENALHRASHGDFVATEGEVESFYRAMLAAAPHPSAQPAEPTEWLIRYNSDGEFGARIGWLVREGGEPCAVSGAPVYVWRPLADFLKARAASAEDHEFWLGVMETLDAQPAEPTWDQAQAARSPVALARARRLTQPAEPKERKPLTDDEIKSLCKDAFGIDPILDGNLMRYARAIERAHGIQEQPKVRRAP